MHAGVLVAVPLAVEDGRVAPGAVEAHVGNRQVRLPLRTCEGDRAVDERALRRIGIRIRGKLSLRGHRDGHSDARLRWDGHGVGREGQTDTRVRPVGGAECERVSFNGRRERLASERVGAVGVRDVGQLYLEAPSVGSVAQVSLGTRRIRGSHHARVHRRGRGRHRVHQAGADLTRRVERAIRLRRVHHRVGGAHQKVRDHRILVSGAHAGEHRIVGDTLTHEGSDTRDLSRGLGRAGPATVGPCGQCGHDVATGGGNLGLETQIRSYAPGGEERGCRPGKRFAVALLDLIEGGGCQGVRVERGPDDRAIVGVGDKRQIVAVPVAPRGGRVVTGGGVDSNPLSGQGGVDVGIDSQGVAILPGIISDGHDKNVGG